MDKPGKKSSVTGMAGKNVPVIPRSIGSVAPPSGYTRQPAEEGGFQHWLRALPLRKEKTVYLFNGLPKPNQSAQYAVLDMPVGDKDLQQCADVVMRLRAEYLFSQKKYDSIRFRDYEGREYAWEGGGDPARFGAYLEKVFGWCGSASLERQLHAVSSVGETRAGDVWIRGGFPGHAMLVADVAINEKGEKVFLLVQGYQPAQDMHVVVNPGDAALSPWYRAEEGRPLLTPEWHFAAGQLRRW